MKKSIKLMSVILAFIMTLSICSIAFADDSSDNEPIRFSTINTVSSDIDISGITATCFGQVTSRYSTTLKIKLELQKKKSGVYETIKTWTESKSNSMSFSMTKTRAINVLSTYRLKATFTAGSESTTMYVYP